MLTGLTLMGVDTVRSEWSRRTGAVVLATGVFGWVYNLTDSGAVLEARSVHVGFGLLFSLGWVVLGVGLLAAGTKLAF
jgi:succinate dehydrogenase/fumarate reductase flavoprotein subunit